MLMPLYFYTVFLQNAFAGNQDRYISASILVINTNSPIRFQQYCSMKVGEEILCPFEADGFTVFLFIGTWPERRNRSYVGSRIRQWNKDTSFHPHRSFPSNGWDCNAVDFQIYH